MAAQKPPTYSRIAAAHASGGYHFSDPAELAEQRSIFWEMFKQIAGGVTTGKFNLISISFPVRLFEPRSYLERITDGWCFLPMWMDRAAAASDPVERMRCVIAHAITGLQNTCKQKKPWNPILGETYEAKLEDGSQVYLEQSSHHPPITNWQVFGPENKWKFYGYGEWTASFGINTAGGGQKGNHYCEFPDGTIIRYTLPDISLGGVMYGERILNYIGSMIFEDKKNGLRAEIHIPPPATAQQASWVSGWFAEKTPTDYLRGTIFRLDAANNATAVSEVEGSWLGCLLFDGRTYWQHAGGAVPSVFAPVENPLPSDCRFREDVSNLKLGNLEEAAKWKHTLEEKQRRDRKLRAEATGKPAH